MAYINTGIKLPGILELLYYKPSTGKTLSDFTQSLLHGPSGLTPAERELIASYVSKLNECNFCHDVHSASAAAHLNDGGNTVSCIVNDFDAAPISPKMKLLLKIAGKVTKSGLEVKQEDVNDAMRNGATDEDVHDTVLIAAAFCMFNRYVDGLGTKPIKQKSDYLPLGKRLATKGYKYAPSFLRRFVIRMMEKQLSGGM